MVMAVSKLPQEMLCHVFSFLTEMIDCASAARVCRLWRQIIVYEKDPAMVSRLQRLSQGVQASARFSSAITINNQSGFGFSRVNESGSIVGIHDSKITYCHFIRSTQTRQKIHEKCLGYNRRFSFWKSLAKLNRLIVRDAETLQHVAETDLNLPSTKDITCFLLGAFPMPESETNFVTVSLGVVVQWELHGKNLEKRKLLRLFEKACTPRRRIANVFRVENTLIFNVLGTISVIFASKEREG